MFCENCGKEIADNAKVCDGCNTAVKPKSVVPTAEENADAKIQKSKKEPLFSKINKAINKNPKLRLARNMLIIAVLVLITVSIAFCALKRSEHEVLIENYLNAQSSGDGVALQKYVGDPYYIEYITDKDGFDIDVGRLGYYFRAMAEDSMDNYEDYYGDNVKCTAKIDYTRKYDAKEVKDIAKYLKDKYAYDEDSVRGVYLIEYDGNIKGDNVSSDYKQGRIVLVKIDKTWYVSRLLSKKIIDDILA